MIKIFLIFISFFFILNCSLDTKSGIWSERKKISETQIINIRELFEEEKPTKDELNREKKINLTSKTKKNSFIKNLSNSNGRVNFNGDLKNISKYKYSKIDKFDQFEPEFIFSDDSIIFFENKGSIIKFSNNSKIIWKKNHYSKSEKKLQPVLTLANNDEILVVADSIAKYYAVNIHTGELLWSKNHTNSFNSQIKIFEDRFFVVDVQNVLRCFSIKNGQELWSYKTERYVIKSPKKLSIILSDNKVVFNNSLGDVTALNIKTGELLWMTPTLSSLVIESKIFLKTSDLIIENDSILFSNNQNEFFSIDLNSGSLNWKKNINSNLRPTLIDDYIFTISMEGFLIIIENSTGNIIRITDLFKNFKKKKRSKIYPIGFIVGTDNIYLTTNTGKLMIIDIKEGKTNSILKIDNDRISRPFVLNQNLYIIKENSIIRLN